MISLIVFGPLPRYALDYLRTTPEQPPYIPTQTLADLADATHCSVCGQPLIEGGTVCRECEVNRSEVLIAAERKEAWIRQEFGMLDELQCPKCGSENVVLEPHADGGKQARCTACGYTAE